MLAGTHQDEGGQQRTEAKTDQAVQQRVQGRENPAPHRRGARRDWSLRSSTIPAGTRVTRLATIKGPSPV